MPANVLYSWESAAAVSRCPSSSFCVSATGGGRWKDDQDQDHNNIDRDESTLCSGVDLKSKMGRRLWQQVLRSKKTKNGDNSIVMDGNTVDKERPEKQVLLLALSKIRIMDDDYGSNDDDNEDVLQTRDWLDCFHGRLSSVPSELIEALRRRAPSQFSARVADFNDNLLYDMQETRGLKNLVVDDDLTKLDPPIRMFEDFLSADEYLGSFLTTESSLPQPPHVDYTWEVLEAAANPLMIGFFPLTREGMFLQVWPTCPDPEDMFTVIEGEIIFIPYGKILLLPASTIHGGGFRTSSIMEDGPHGNLRFHLYVAPHGSSLPRHQNNKYTEQNDRRKELALRYVDNRHLEPLLQSFFE